MPDAAALAERALRTNRTGPTSQSTSPARVPSARPAREVDAGLRDDVIGD